MVAREVCSVEDGLMEVGEEGRKVGFWMGSASSREGGRRKSVSSSGRRERARDSRNGDEPKM